MMNSLTKEGKIVVFGGLALLIAVAIGIYWWQRGDARLVQPPSNKDQEPVYCTQDAKLCPDGSYVSRMGPSCEFAACPGE